MMKSKYTDRFWYFRNVADEDDDDFTGDSLLIPVSSITGIAMRAGTQKLDIWFEGARNKNTMDSAGAEDTPDGHNGYVTLTITAGKGKEVTRALVEIINRGPHHDGVTVIADDSTTDFDGTVRNPVYANGFITGCFHIENSNNGQLVG